MTTQVEDLIEAIQNKGKPCIHGEEARKSIALLEACYAQRKPLALPWIALDVQAWQLGRQTDESA